jgi:hypothetical protein
MTKITNEELYAVEYAIRQLINVGWLRESVKETKQ